MTTQSTGYFRDADAILYLTSAGRAYYVQGPDNPEPVWRECDGDLSPDVEPTTPDQEDLEVFERYRVAFGIPA
jgi:hypothetical protein